MRKEKWLIQAKKADFDILGKTFGISPVLARIIRNRGYETNEGFELYLHGSEKDMHSPWKMKDMKQSVELILEKIREKKKIRIIGDYDIDGVCATYILVDGLKKIGADVSMDIPDRVKDGYGINENLIRRAYETGIDTIITCDNGIAAIEQIAYAKELGMTVIVTDHHEIPYREENGEKKYLRVGADAVINPKQPECEYPFPKLCGAAVAYKLVQALYASIGKIEDRPDVILEEYIEFAAIATIGDVMDLEGENRIITKLGLKRIQETKNPGLHALIEVNQLAETEITAYHIGFVLGPCMNATGRLETAKHAFEMLCARTKEEAMSAATNLKELNEKRKALTEEGLQEGILACESFAEDRFLLIYLPKVHESIAGIIAGRLREKYHKPVIVLTKAEEGVKGSGRSIPGCHMFEELTACHTLLDKFGGHELAAGLSLKEENIALLREQLNRQTRLTDEDLIPKIWIDVPMPFEYVTQEFVKELKKLEPFGKGNEKPVFAEKNLSIVRIQVIGKNQDSLKLGLKNERGFYMTALLFRQAQNFLEEIKEQFGGEELRKCRIGLDNQIRISVIYYPQVNEYRGNVETQIIINNYCF